MTAPPPRLGFFWFVPDAEGTRLVAYSLPFDEVPEIGGFRTVELGHYEHWPALGRRDRLMRTASYEDYPRGRINYVVEDGRFLLLADRKLMCPHYIDRLMTAFALPRHRVTVATDPHYRSRLGLEDPS